VKVEGKVEAPGVVGEYHPVLISLDRVGTPLLEVEI